MTNEVNRYISDDNMLMQEWDFETNVDLDSKMLKRGSNRKVWWKCKKCGYKWKTRIIDRTRDGTGCPACANRVTVLGINDLASKFPEIAKEWNYDKNGDLEPDGVVYKSKRKVWWKCSNGHEFKQSIELRTVRGYGCPYCANRKVLMGYNDLSTTHPHIAKEWYQEKNGILRPTDMIAGSNKKVWWLCAAGHGYEQTIYKRTMRGQSCPYCSGHKAWEGLNDFQTRFPEIVKEWHPTKNDNLKPTQVTYGSGKKVWWKCPVGHEYQAIVRDRGIGGTNCPICWSRFSTSFGEQAVWYYVKKIYPDALNKFKELFDFSMEFDVYIPSIKVAIEYDGCYWHQSEEVYGRELKKYKFCKTNSIVLYRIKEENNQSWDDVADKIFSIKKIKRQNFTELEKVIKNIIRDINPTIDIDINIARDKYDILDYLSSIKNSLANERPDVVAKWNLEKNGTLTPEMFTVSSNEIVWWKCPACGNEWESSINSMTREGRFGCAICSREQQGKTFTKGVVNKVGSLVEMMPELSKEWHPTKNRGLTPYDVTAGKFKSVWWLCKKCGYEWEASPANRKKGVGCPCCSGRVPQIGVNDLETKYPDIAKEWDYEKNSPLTPKEFLPKSGKKVWWKCSICGKSWESIIRNRTKNGLAGCRSCKRNLEKK